MNTYSTNWKTLPSTEDLSVNFLQPTLNGKHETRFVRRQDDYFIVYLSSHDGCKMGCRFCHLTQMRLNSFVPVTMSEYIDQAKKVLSHYDGVVGGGGQPEASCVHFNFMARGEALANPVVLHEFSELKAKLEDLSDIRNLESKFKVSTIMPKMSQDFDLIKISGNNVALYYSLYSLNAEFRRKWLPNAMDAYEALDRLARWQDRTNGRIVLHWALIENENDSIEEAQAIANAINARGIKTKFNLVRYNTPGPQQGCESNDGVRDNYFKTLSRALSHPSKIVPRVGFDVAASCGMFIA